VGEALWAHDRQIADEALLAELLDNAGHDGQAIVNASKDEAFAQVRSDNAQEAIELDVVGVPSYVYQGEVFWGQDRIEYLDHALATERAPITKG
jgi:2-hydroxychromene-2-carboxylate isomerase